MESIDTFVSTAAFTSASLRKQTMARLRSHLRPGQSVDQFLNELMDDDLTYAQRLEVARREREEVSVPWEVARRSLPALAPRRRRG